MWAPVLVENVMGQETQKTDMSLISTRKQAHRAKK